MLSIHPLCVIQIKISSTQQNFACPDVLRPVSPSFANAADHLIFTSLQLFIFANLPQLVEKRESCTSLPLKHLTYPSVALHVPDVIPFPGHHERVHRCLSAQPRRETSRSVRTASSGQCFRNPLHDLPAPVDSIWYSILAAPQFSLPNLQFLLHIVTHLVHGVLQCQVHLDTVLRFHMALMHPHDVFMLHIAAPPSVPPHSPRKRFFLFCLQMSFPYLL